MPIYELVKNTILHDKIDTLLNHDNGNYCTKIIAW